MPELLEFEEPVGVLLKEIEALSMLPQTPERQRSIDTLRRRAEEIRSELYASLTPWQRVLVARHSARPNTLDYVNRLFTAFDELHGDRRVLLELDVKKNGGPGLRVRADVAQRVRPSEKLVEEVEQLCGSGSVVLR